MIFLHAFNELGALQGQRALARHRFEQLQIITGEFSAALVQRLCDANDLTLYGTDGDAENIARREACLFINRSIKACIRVGVVNDQCFASGIDMSSDAAVIEEADLALDVSLRDAGIQFVRIRVVHEQRASLCVQFRRRHIHQ